MAIKVEAEEVLARMDRIPWNWASQDRNAVEMLEWRIIRKAKDKGFVNYSELADKVEFKVREINDGKPYFIDVKNWQGLDRKLIGEFLGYLSRKSYREHGFMISAIVIEKESHQPSFHFFDFMRDLGILEDASDDGILRFWAKQFKAIHRHYSVNRDHMLY